MKITSYFTGITVKKESFIDLFIKLQKYFKENEPKSIVTFQNILSLHITLYYFGNKIDEKNLKKIKLGLNHLRKTLNNSEIVVNEMNFFEHSEKIICYISPLSSVKLDEINNFFREKYKINLGDNDRVFVPHITIFKTSNIVFKKHQIQIKKIVEDFLNKNKKINIFSDINLYCVNSDYSPEIQIPIY